MSCSHWDKSVQLICETTSQMWFAIHKKGGFNSVSSCSDYKRAIQIQSVLAKNWILARSRTKPKCYQESRRCNERKAPNILELNRKLIQDKLSRVQKCRFNNKTSNRLFAELNISANLRAGVFLLLLRMTLPKTTRRLRSRQRSQSNLIAIAPNHQNNC